MKKVIQLLSVTLIASVILISCSSKKDATNTASTNITKSTENTQNIAINTPITLSNNDMYSVTSKHEFLRIKMIKGKYYENWDPGAYMGPNWEGEFVFELADESGKVIKQTELKKSYSESLIFNSEFKLEFDDYNNDGDIDFTLGQYASSNGRDYKLFTLRKDGRVEELPIKDYPTLFISSTTGRYSTKLSKVDQNTFKIEYYDNSQAKTLTEYFKWDNNQFIKTDAPQADTKDATGIWTSYENKDYHVSYKFPSDWELVSGYYNPRFEGKDGFVYFDATGAGNPSIDDAADNEAHHKLQPYGTNPQITKLTVQGQEARLITPSEDQPKEMSNQSGLIIRYPAPVKIGDGAYSYFVLYADKDHIDQIAKTFAFSD